MARKCNVPVVIAVLVSCAVGVCLPFVAVPLVAQESQETLGDAARRIRAEKKKAAGQITGAQPTAPKTEAAGARLQKDFAIWGQLYDRGDEAMLESDYVKAERLFREALAFAEEHHTGMTSVAATNEQIGWALQAQRRYEEAEAFYRSALQTRRNFFPENNEHVARNKAGLGITLVGLARYEEAERLLLEALSAYHQNPEATLCALSYPLDGLTMLYKSTHQYSKGGGVYTEAFALMASNRGTPCENFALMLDHLAALYADDNQWDKVEKIQQGRASLALGMKGEKSELYGDALFAVGDTLQKRRRFDEAAAQYAQAANIFRHTDPPSPDKLARSLESQEMALQLAGKREDADKLHASVLAATQASHTDDAEGEMMSVRMRALEARRNGKQEEAAQLFAREVMLSQNLSPRDQMIALNDSAMVHQEQQDMAAAEKELQRVLELSIASTGPSSHATAQAHFELAMFYTKTKRPKEADESYAAALALLGEQDTQELKTALATQGWAHVTDGKYEQAEAEYQRLMKLAGDTHDNATLSTTLQCLAILYQKTSRPRDADAAITRAMNLAEQLPKPMNRLWVPAAMTAGMLYQQSGRTLQAEQLYGRIILFVEQQYGPDHPGLRMPLDKLIAILKAQGRANEAAKYEARRDKLPPMPPIPGMTQ